MLKSSLVFSLIIFSVLSSDVHGTALSNFKADIDSRLKRLSTNTDTLVYLADLNVIVGRLRRDESCDLPVLANPHRALSSRTRRHAYRHVILAKAVSCRGILKRRATYLLAAAARLSDLSARDQGLASLNATVPADAVSLRDKVVALANRLNLQALALEPLLMKASSAYVEGCRMPDPTEAADALHSAEAAGSGNDAYAVRLALARQILLSERARIVSAACVDPQFDTLARQFTTALAATKAVAENKAVTEMNRQACQSLEGDPRWASLCLTDEISVQRDYAIHIALQHRM